MKLVNPINPSSEYVAPMTFFANNGKIGPCSPYEIPMIKAVMLTRIRALFICMLQPLLPRP